MSVWAFEAAAALAGCRIVAAAGLSGQPCLDSSEFLA